MNGSPFLKGWAIMAVILVALTSNELRAQCDPPDLLPTVDCAQAPEVCLQDACYSTNTQVMTGHQGFCGNNTIINNPQYFIITATSTTIQINIHVETPCSGGNGALQSAIVQITDMVDPLDSCNMWTNDDVLACNPGTPPGGTMVLIANNAVIGEQYLFLIDGSNGAQCQYTIEFADGVYEPQIDEDLTTIDPDNATACLGQDELMIEVGPNILNAHGYIWETDCLDPPIQTTTLPELLAEIPDNAPTGPCQICARAFSGCDTSDVEICMTVDLFEVSDEDSEPVTICDEDLPYQWNSVVINGPGTYTETFDTPEGCPYDSILVFDVYPIADEGLVDTVYCGVDFFYEGEQYSASGEYDLFYQDGSQYGCDSMATLDLTLSYIEFDIMMECEDQMFKLCPLVYAKEPNNALTYYKWYNSIGDLISEDECVLVSAEDFYNLFITLEVDGVHCEYEAFQTFEVVHEGFLPEPPAFIDSLTEVCGGVVTFAVEQESGVITWDWTGPSMTSIFGNGFHEVEIDFSSSSGGLVCVEAVNDCGTGEQNCIEVAVIEPPVAAFDMPNAICVDSIVSVEFTGTASGNAILNWDFGEADVISGSGEGPYVLSFPTQGSGYPISLEIIEPGCDTVSNTQMIDVENLSAPVISCSSTIDEITFSWTDNGNMYTVNQMGGPAGTQNGTTFTVSNLNPGESVTIEVFATNNGPCGTVVSTFMCSAANCPDPGLELQLPDSICLNEVSGTLSLTATAGGDPAMGTWSGPGIINTMTGEFDPMDGSAGIGQHNVVFIYTDTAGCISQTSGVINVFNAPTTTFQATPEVCEGDIVNINYMGNAGASATFNWNFDGGTVVAGSGSGPYQIQYNNSGTYTVNLSVEQNRCVSAPQQFDVNVSPELQPITWNCAPQTSEVLLTWDIDPNATNYNVNFLFGGPCMVIDGEVYCDNLMPGDSIAVEVVAVGDGICPDVRDTISCVAKQCPLISLDIDTVQPICLYPGISTIDLNVTITNQNGGSGSWSGPGIIDNANGIFDPATAGSGMHNATFSYMEDGCTFNKSITIRVNDPPTAAIIDQGYILNCDNNNMVTLDGTGSSPAANLEYLWSTTNGSIISGANTVNPVVGAMGDYQLLVRDMITGCVDSATIFVDQDDDVPIADAGSQDILTCDVEVVTVGGSSSTGSDIVYLWSTTDGNIVGSNAGMTIMVNTPGTYQIEVTDTVSGCISSDNVTINQDIELPVPSASVDDILDCDTEIVSITGSTSQGLPGYAYRWTTADGHIVGASDQEVITADEPGFYTFIVTNTTNGCTDSATIEVVADPEFIADIELEFEPPLCFGDANGVVTVSNIMGGTPPFTYTWSPLSNTDSVLTNVPAGTYAVTVTDANGCTDMAEVSLNQPVDLAVDLGDNIFVNLGDSVVVIANPNIALSEISTITWSGLFNDQCSGCDMIFFEADESGTVMVEIVDVNGCVATASLVVDVNRPKFIFVPNIFSPNGDGINDFFNIFANLETEEISDFRIYNRWGEVVYYEEIHDFNNPAAGWDGRTGGKESLPGVYVYSALIKYTDGFEEVIKGDITLIR